MYAQIFTNKYKLYVIFNNLQMYEFKIKVSNEKTMQICKINQENIRSFCLWFLFPLGFNPLDGFEQ